MIDFEGYYLVPPDQVAYIETRRGGGDAQYGLWQRGCCFCSCM